MKITNPQLQNLLWLRDTAIPWIETHRADRLRFYNWHSTDELGNECRCLAGWMLQAPGCPVKTPVRDWLWLLMNTFIATPNESLKLMVFKIFTGNKDSLAARKHFLDVAIELKVREVAESTDPLPTYRSKKNVACTPSEEPEEACLEVV